MPKGIYIFINAQGHLYIYKCPWAFIKIKMPKGIYEYINALGHLYFHNCTPVWCEPHHSHTSTLSLPHSNTPTPHFYTPTPYSYTPTLGLGNILIYE